MNITELRTKSLKLAHEGRDLLNTIKADGSNEAEVMTQFDAMMKESDGLNARADGLTSVEARDKAMNEIVTDVPAIESRSGNVSEEKRAAALDSYLRGRKSFGELRAMGITGQEGVITPTTFTTTLLTHLVTEGPMLDGNFIDLLVTETGNPIAFPTFNDDGEAVIIGENTLIPEDELEYGQKNIGAYKYTSKNVRISNELLQDGAIDVASHVAKALAARIGRTVNRHLTVGTGVNQPEGIVTAAVKSGAVTTASATAVAFEELVKLQHSIDAAYRGNAKWMLNDAAIAKFRGMRDGDNTLIWRPGMELGAPSTLLGKAYVTNKYMDDTFATGKVVALYGDFKAYMTRRAKDIFVRRLEERYADFDQTAFIGLARFDGGLLDTSAVKALKLA